MVVDNEEIDLGDKNLLSWQDTWNSRQIITNIEEKLGNQKEVIYVGGISFISSHFLIK